MCSIFNTPVRIKGGLDSRFLDFHEMQEIAIADNIDGLWEAFEKNSASFGPLVDPFATLAAVCSEVLPEGSAAFDAALKQAPDDECARIMALTPKRPSAALQRLQAQSAAPAQAPIAEERAPLVAAPAPATNAPMIAPDLPDSERAAQPEAMVTGQHVNGDDEAISTPMDVEDAQPEATVTGQPAEDLPAGDECAVATERAGPVNDEAIPPEMDVVAAQPEAAATETAVATAPARARTRTRGVRKKQIVSPGYKGKPTKWKQCSPLAEAISANLVVELDVLRIVTRNSATKSGKSNKEISIEEAKALTHAKLTELRVCKQVIEAHFKQWADLPSGKRKIPGAWLPVTGLMSGSVHTMLNPKFHHEITDQGLGHLLDRH